MEGGKTRGLENPLDSEREPTNSELNFNSYCDLNFQKDKNARVN